MHSEILLIICATFGLAKSFPVQVYEYINPATGNLEVFEIVNDPDYVDSGHKQVKKSILNPCIQSQNGDVECFFQNEDGIRRNTELEESPKFSFLPHVEDNFGMIDQSQWDYNEPRLDYDKILQNSGIVFEEYPYVNPSEMNFNQGLSTPATSYSTHIHGLVPTEDAAPNYNNNIYQPQNITPLNMRMARKTSSYDEFLAQLAHDAMLNNILPTMPYVRSSSVGYNAPYGPAQAVALYPGLVPGGQNCAQPILVGCSPNIYQGSLVPRSRSLGHQYFAQHAPFYSTGHVLTNLNEGHEKVKPHVILPNQNYRKTTADLVAGKKN